VDDVMFSIVGHNSYFAFSCVLTSFCFVTSVVTVLVTCMTASYAIAGDRSVQG